MIAYLPYLSTFSIFSMNSCAPCSSRPNLILIKPSPPVFKTLSLLRCLHSARLHFVSRFFTKNIFSFCGCKVKSFFCNLQILFQKFLNFFFPLNPLQNAASNPPGIAAVVLKSGCKYRHAFLFYNTFPKKDFAFLYPRYDDHLYINHLSVNIFFRNRHANRHTNGVPASRLRDIQLQDNIRAGLKNDWWDYLETV